MKNEKWKKIFNFIAVIFSAVCAFFCGVLSSRRNRSTIDGGGKQLERVGESEQRKAEAIGRVEELERTEGERIRDSKRLLEEIRSRKQKETND